MVPTGERALAWVRKYLQEGRPSLVVESDSGFLFLTFHVQPLSVSWLTGRVRDYIRSTPRPPAARLQPTTAAPGAEEVPSLAAEAADDGE